MAEIRLNEFDPLAARGDAVANAIDREKHRFGNSGDEKAKQRGNQEFSARIHSYNVDYGMMKSRAGAMN